MHHQYKPIKTSDLLTPKISMDLHVLPHRDHHSTHQRWEWEYWLRMHNSSLARRDLEALLMQSYHKTIRGDTTNEKIRRK